MGNLVSQGKVEALLRRRRRLNSGISVEWITNLDSLTEEDKNNLEATIESEAFTADLKAATETAAEITITSVSASIEPEFECEAGQTKEVDCNTCSCQDGNWVCTEIACEPTTPPPVGECDCCPEMITCDSGSIPEKRDLQPNQFGCECCEWVCNSMLDDSTSYLSLFIVMTLTILFMLD